MERFQQTFVEHDVMISRRLLLLIFFAVRMAAAQTPTPAFEAATIKPAATPSDGHTHINYPPNDRFSSSNITVLNLMQWAYGMPEKQILGGPAWLGSSRFDIQAEADIGEHMKNMTLKEGNELKQRMVQALLADRFQLKLHQETRMLPAYDLVLAKGGEKLRPSKSNGRNIGAGRTHFNGEGLDMTFLAEGLSKITGRVVVDKTGLTGRYDFKLVWTADDAALADGDPPTLFTAIQEQLGLKLEPAKEPVPVVVIDHVDQPTPN
jgi:uncharacterized protein (TIGR03435 family)